MFYNNLLELLELNTNLGLTMKRNLTFLKMKISIKHKINYNFKSNVKTGFKSIT